MAVDVHAGVLVSAHSALPATDTPFTDTTELVGDATTLRAPLSGTFLQKEGCRKPVLVVCSATTLKI